MAVSAYITFCRPSTLVLHIRKMCWKFWDWNWIDIFEGGRRGGDYILARRPEPRGVFGTLSQN
eukprot:CAMPEP_0206457212 /NCGR_PEP_ID=MMETSP0324_2-20121206/22826_1 /ASSEMBLY_ACC=CAM_ASM_000836 /TAXON_ID=2866 /ORGANISM="Crypthecodinium cohnii, Strain Seligo" /LENGTH=62 /DNA_ID=CAMNT_0053928289 /DNA_START=1 /DNA_END=186 /DNA_ORIENTATION=-